MLSLLTNLDLIFLFFFLGAFSSWVNSDLQVPEQIAKFLSVFLLLSLGLKGGHEVRVASDLSGLFPVLSLGLLTCLFIPTYIYYMFGKSLGFANSAAIASCYGSVSAVTFIAAQGFLENEGIPTNGYMIAVMALMEIPAIIVSLFLFHRIDFQNRTNNTKKLEISIFSAKSVVLLLGGFAIGILMNNSSWDSIKPVVKDSFKGVLAFFLLDLGIVAQKQFSEAWRHKGKALIIAIFLPLIHGTLALLIARFLNLTAGNQILIAVLAGSASYIAAPAAIRSSIPQANPSLYVAMPLALTFPMNVLIGIPYYVELSRFLN